MTMDAREATVADSTGEDAREDPREHMRFLVVALCVSIAALWVPLLFGSLGLDETGTYFVIKDGFTETVQRSSEIQGQSPLYYVLAWTIKTLFGSDELVLRLPSFLISIVSVFVIIKLGSTLFNREAGIIAAIVFVGIDSVSAAASDARPYALALLLVLTSTLLLVRWLDTADRRYAAGYALVGALIVYAHYLFALLFLVHAFYIVHRRASQQTTVRMGAIFASYFAITALTVPLVPQLMALLARRSELVIPPPLSFSYFMSVLVPPALTIAMGAGWLLAGGDRRFHPSPAKPGALPLTVTWLATSPILLYVVSVTTPVALFQRRYYLVAVPGLALLTGYAVRCMKPPRARRTVVVIAMALLALAGPPVRNEDWRQTASIVNQAVADEHVPVLLQSGFVEARTVEILDEEGRVAFLASPFSYYPIRGRLIPLPFDLGIAARRYMRRLVDDRLEGVERLVVVSREPDAIGNWLEATLAGEGFEATPLGSPRLINVTLFTRNLDRA